MTWRELIEELPDSEAPDLYEGGLDEYEIGGADDEADVR